MSQPKSTKLTNGGSATSREENDQNCREQTNVRHSQQNEEVLLIKIKLTSILSTFFCPWLFKSLNLMGQKRWKSFKMCQKLQLIDHELLITFFLYFESWIYLPMYLCSSAYILFLFMVSFENWKLDEDLVATHVWKLFLSIKIRRLQQKLNKI